MTMTLRAFNEMFPDEDAASARFEKSRRWNWIACHHQFSVTAETPMHRTHLPLLTWAHAIYLIVSSSKGVSAMKLSEMPGVSNATAWHLGHRIRLMMAEPNPILSGVVEIGEMYACVPVQRAKGVQHSIRWEEFHRRPAIVQSLLQWGNTQRGPDVSSDHSTRFGARWANLIVPIGSQHWDVGQDEDPEFKNSLSPSFVWATKMLFEMSCGRA